MLLSQMQTTFYVSLTHDHTPPPPDVNLQLITHMTSMKSQVFQLSAFSRGLK